MQTQGLTGTLAAQAAAYTYGNLPDEAANIAKQCLLDFLGVTFAGAGEPLTAILHAEALAEGGNPQASLIGLPGRVTATQAALINGSASHALDYDDVQLLLMGHPTVPVAPVVFALAEQYGKSGSDLIAAFVAGFETECRIGAGVSPSHYAAGWHATATIGCFGAAAAAANLLKLDADTTAMALGIAGTQASGFKSMFGTMCKPFHAGHAAMAGLMAARLAARGFTSRPDVLEVEQGFADTQSKGLRPEAALEAPIGGSHIRNTLFKYHAACYLTHSSLEAAHGLRRQHDIAADKIRAVRVMVDKGHFRVCNIQSPATGLETKFSLRATTAFALTGLDTAGIDTFSDENANRPDVVSLRDRVTVEAHNKSDPQESEVIIDMLDGRSFALSANVGLPARDLNAQWEKLTDKFHAIADPVIGKGRAVELAAAIRNLESLNNFADLGPLLRAG
ncbi:MAG: MmgE/PrpD family protein [Alphaproteobacteria bacterium]